MLASSGAPTCTPDPSPTDSPFRNEFPASGESLLGEDGVTHQKYEGRVVLCSDAALHLILRLLGGKTASTRAYGEIGLFASRYVMNPASIVPRDTGYGLR